MINKRSITNIPKERLTIILSDVSNEKNLISIYAYLQENNAWTVDYMIGN